MSKVSQFAFVFFCIVHLSLGQIHISGASTTEDKGDGMFAVGNYQKALELYKNSHTENEKDELIWHKIALTYYELRDSKKQVEWFDKIVDSNGTLNPDEELYYAQALAEEKEYGRAKKWFLKYNQNLNNGVAFNQIKAIDDIEALKDSDVDLALENLSFNSEDSEFSAFSTGKELVFIKQDADNTDFYSSVLENDDYSPVQKANKALNTSFNEGPFAYFDGGSKIVFTSNNNEDRKAKKDENGNINLGIFFSEKENGDWSRPISYKYNQERSSTAHPTISQDGKTLFFSSNRKGGVGENDIYVSKKIGNDWTEPENLGDIINTEGREMFPYIDGDILYFASNGHGGLGGLDLFKVDLSKDNYVVQNLKSPFNSNRDDFSIQFTSPVSGFFTSNRDGGKGADDIYEFLIRRKMIKVNGVVKDGDGNLVKNAFVQIIDGLDNVISQVQVGEDGAYDIEGFADANSKVRVRSKSHFFEVRPLDLSTRTSSFNAVLQEAVLYKGTINSPHGGIKGAKITFTDHNGNVLTSITDELGEYSVKLKPNKYYHINAIDSELQPIVSDKIVSGDDRIKIYTKNFNIQEAVSGDAISLKNIYFDLNSAKITQKSAEDLDKLVVLLKQNTSINITLASHTDSRGSSIHNKSLSKKRAKSCLEYLKNAGIALNRLEAKAYGEKNLVNGCKSGVPCSEAQHAENRRTEFSVTTNASGNGTVLYVGGDANDNNGIDISGPSYKTLLSRIGDKSAENVEIRISLGLFAKFREQDYSELKDLGEVKKIESPKFTRYYLTGFNTMNEAETARKELIKRGYKTTYLMFFENGKNISTRRFNQLLSQ